jgi:hypothetical protein
VNPEIAARLEALGFQWSWNAKGWAMFIRDECVAIASTDEHGFIGLGSSGMMTEQGLAYLIWRDGAPLLAAKEGERPAEADQVEKIRKFSGDLKAALGLE